MQTFIVALIVLGVVIYLIHRFRLALGKANSGNCGCAGCERDRCDER